MKGLSELFHHNRTPVFVLIRAILMPLLYSERTPQAAPCIVGATLAVALAARCLLCRLYGYLSLVDECAAACDVGLPPCVYGEPADSHSVRDDETRTKYHLVELYG